jgi:hypothetical protein
MNTTTAPLDLDAALDDVLDDDTEQVDEHTPVRREPYIAALRVGQLFADRTYQRELDQHRVKRMAASYDVALVGIVEVADRGDGAYALLDGQHRVATVREISIADPVEPHLPCRVHTGLTITEEAELYHRLNTTRKQLTGWDRWLARRAAADQLVLDIETTAHHHGFTVGMTTAAGVLRATRACEKVVELGDVRLLDTTLATIRAAYRDDQAGLDAAIIHGLAHVLHAYSRSELDLQRLVETLAGILPRQLTARAAAVRELHRGTLERLTAHVIVERYNEAGRPKLEPFLERVPSLSKASGNAARENQAIREWAEREGIELTTKQIPRSVREAYAHRDDDIAQEDQ